MSQEKKYRCLANVLTAGKSKDYKAGQIVSAGEFNQLKKKIKVKFEEVTLMPLVTGDQAAIVKALQDKDLQIAQLEELVAELQGKVKALEGGVVDPPKTDPVDPPVTDKDKEE